MVGPLSSDYYERHIPRAWADRNKNWHEHISLKAIAEKACAWGGGRRGQWGVTLSRGLDEDPVKESSAYADLSIDDYAERTAETRPAWKAMSGQQANDPVKFA
jgi:hypothetical protein